MNKNIQKMKEKFYKQLKLTKEYRDAIKFYRRWKQVVLKDRK